ncbi:MAG: hypothetical protein ACTIAR_04700 [Brachybacterium tyrofermentans]
MNTNPQRVHLSANSTDTAVLLSMSKALPPYWAAITRGSATAFIAGHHGRHDRLQPLSRADALLLIPLVAGVAIAGYLYLYTATTLWWFPLVLLGGLFVLTHLPTPLPREVHQQVTEVTHQNEILTPCPVSIALELTEAQHSALRVAEDYEVVDEVLGALIERHQVQTYTEQTRRRDLAEEIMNNYATKGSRHPENTGS